MAVFNRGGGSQWLRPSGEKSMQKPICCQLCYAKIESQLGVKAFEIQGRKAILTPTGQMLYRRALALVTEAKDLEYAAHKLAGKRCSSVRRLAEILMETVIAKDKPI